MKVCDIFVENKANLIKIRAKIRKKNNPIPSKTTKLSSFIDVFGGMAGYDDPSKERGVNPIS